MKKLFVAISLLAGLGVQPLFACAACYGQSDSPMASGLNWGIAFLLGVVGAVVMGVLAFFVHVGRKSAALNGTGAPDGILEAEK